MTPDSADTLRRHGVHVTAQRIAVLRAVEGRAHVTADEAGDIARSHLGAISRQSVYDTLAVLVDHGLIRRIQPSGSPARYEGRVGDNHHHVVCRACGHLADVECTTGDAPCLTPADPQDFTIDEAEVIYWGLCPDCSTDELPATTSQERNA